MASSTVVLVLGLGVLFAGVDTTDVRNCRGLIHGKTSLVDISACKAAPCILKKGTTVSIHISFQPEYDIKHLRNRVFARIAGFPLPFVGVDGSSSCPNIYRADDSTQTGCPLKADTEYVYKNSFDVLSIYPSVSPLVHWALQDGSSDIVCFEIQSKIVS